MASINVDKMSLKDLNDLEAKLAKAKAAVKNRAKSEAKQKIDAILESYDFSIGDLYSVSRVGRPRGSAGNKAAKYANPDNTRETWTGRGRKPNWLVAKLAKGASLQDFAI